MQEQALLLVWAQIESGESFKDNEGVNSAGQGEKTDLRGVATSMTSAIGLIWTDYVQLFDGNHLKQENFPLVEKENENGEAYLEVVVEEHVSTEDGQGHYKQTIQWYVEEAFADTLFDEE